jgi:hypothetical protein
MIITSEMLMNMKRPLSEYEKTHFERAFPNGMELNPENLKTANEEASILWNIYFSFPEVDKKISDILEYTDQIVGIEYEDLDREENFLVNQCKARRNGRTDTRADGVCGNRIAQINADYYFKRKDVTDLRTNIHYAVASHIIALYLDESFKYTPRGQFEMTSGVLKYAEPRACKDQTELFEKEYPNGLIVSSESVNQARKLHLDIGWFLYYRTNDKLKEEYYEIEALLYKAISRCRDRKLGLVDYEWEKVTEKICGEDEYQDEINRVCEIEQQGCRDVSEIGYKFLDAYAAEIFNGTYGDKL